MKPEKTKEELFVEIKQLEAKVSELENSESKNRSLLDISKLELSDIIDTEVLQSMMEDFYRLTGMLGAVLDLSGKVLVAVGWSDICTKFHRCNPDTLKNCIESDTVLTQGVPEGTFKSYHCKNNMWDIVTPIVVGGRHVGNVFMGQYFMEDEMPDVEFFRKQAKKYGFDETAYLAALDRVPRFSKEMVNAGMQFYSKLAGIIATLSYSSIQQSRMLAQQKQTGLDLIKEKEKAEESEGKLKAALESMTDAIFISDQEGNFIDFNEAFATFHKYKTKEECAKTLKEFPVFLDVFNSDGKLLPLEMWVVSRALRGETGLNEEYVLKRKDTGETWVGSYNYSPIRNNEGDIIGSVVTARDITDKKQAEELLKENEAQLKFAQDSAGAGLWDWDLKTNKLVWSPELFTLFGLDSEGIEATFEIWDKCMHPDDINPTHEKLNRSIKEHTQLNIEYRIIQPSGKTVWINAIGNTSYDDEGNALRNAGICIDISERKLEEKILNVELELFEFAINHSEEELLRKFLDEAEKLTGSEIGFYHYIEDDQESISLQTWSSNTLNSMCKGSGEATRHYPISEAGVWIDCIKERKPVIHNDYSSLAHKKGLPEGHAPVIRELVVPVIRGKQIVAVLGVGNKKSDYNQTDAKSVQRLADVAWETVVRKQAEENLQNTFDLSPSIICKANLNTGYFTEANQAVTRILGYTVEEFTSIPFIELIHPDDQQKSSDEKVEQLEGKEVNFFENRYLCKDGSYKWVAWHGTAADENGLVTAIGSDITEQKLTQLKLNQSTKLFEASQSIAKLGGWELDVSTNELFWTAETYRIHDTSPEEFKPTVDAAIGFYLPESRLIISEAMKKAVEKGKGFDFELEVKTAKGRRIDVRATTEVILRNGQPIKLMGIFQDITEKKRAENKIRSAEENLQNTFDLSPSIIAKANMNEGRFIQVNKAITKILGYTVDEFTSRSYMEFVHPDDRQSTIDIATEQLKGNEVTFFENRYLCKDGSYKWMAWHGTKPDNNGVVTTIGSDINERKRIEQQIVETKQFYEDIIEGVQDGIWVTDKNDVIFYANSAMEKIAGVPREQIQGKNIVKDFEEETTGEFIKFYKQAKKEKKPVWYIIKVTTPAHRETWQNGWLIPQYQGETFKGIICTIRDVTERKQAESSVRRLSTAVQQSPSIIVIADTEGKIEYVNPKFTELTGYESAEAIGHESNILKSGEQDVAFYKEMWETVESGKVWRGQFHNKKKNGELFWEAASISAILNEAGDVVNYIKIGEDITQQKNTEKELKKALEKALQSDRLKSAFLANMSHEIRTPMNGILGFINLLNEPNLTTSQIGQYSAIINKSGDRLLNTINDIIDISKIEAGEIVLTTTETSVNFEIEELYSFFLPEANRKGLSLFVEPSLSNEQLTVVTDNHKFHGILTNLIKNAIKYTDKGSITFGYFLKENFIEFYVKDTGIGIPKDRIKAIFNRFEQADIGDKRVFEGSGLGLAISKAYAEMLGGDISVTSVEGKGSIFTFTIPYTKKVKKEIEQAPEHIESKKSRIEDLNLLIVEDDDISSKFLETILKNDFQKILFASDGLKAVEMCEKHPELDLVLMDIKMPKLSGFDATKEIRKFNKDLLIIAQTAYAMHGDKEKAIEAGCNDYITKPINKTLLLEMINRHEF